MLIILFCSILVISFCFFFSHQFSVPLSITIPYHAFFLSSTLYPSLTIFFCLMIVFLTVCLFLLLQIFDFGLYVFFYISFSCSSILCLMFLLFVLLLNISFFCLFLFSNTLLFGQMDHLKSCWFLFQQSFLRFLKQLIQVVKLSSGWLSFHM